jgi:hypothetical protein
MGLPLFAMSLVATEIKNVHKYMLLHIFLKHKTLWTHLLLQTNFEGKTKLTWTIHPTFLHFDYFTLINFPSKIKDNMVSYITSQCSWTSLVGIIPSYHWPKHQHFGRHQIQNLSTQSPLHIDHGNEKIKLLVKDFHVFILIHNIYFNWNITFQ